MKISMYTSISLAFLLCSTIKCVPGGRFAKEFKLPMTILNSPKNKKKNLRYPRVFWADSDSGVDASNSGVSLDDPELHISSSINVDDIDSLDHRAELIKSSNTRNDGAGVEDISRDDEEDIYKENRRALHKARKGTRRRARHVNSQRRSG